MAGTLAGLALCAASAEECAPERVDLRGDWGSARFTVELADEPAEQAQGLMHREKMARGAGMLFIFDKPRHAVFWMRNTLIPLDMIFADENGRVTHVHENAIPLDETGIDGGTDVKFVLEINGGLAGRLGIAEGSELRHPSVEANALWPCE